MNFKQLLFSAGILGSFHSFSQTIEYLDGNNVKALIADDGIFFQDRANSTPSYEYPKDSNTFVAYSMAYWMGGKDQYGNLKLAANTFGSSAPGSPTNKDFYPGPISAAYNSFHYLATYPSAIWKISQDEIDYHVIHYSDPGYTPIPVIQNWPGNGYTLEGIAAQLAPYADVNNDQIYNPMDGDHPFILGDHAVYTIMNDAAGPHLESGGDPLGVEVHSMFYQYETSDEIDNTTFLNVRVINRGTIDYYDYLFGLWMDGDIGLASNDYIGTDTSRNMQYTYNGTSADLYTPAFGFKSLNEDMFAAIYYDNGGGAVRGDPSTATQYFQYMNAQWLNTQHFTYGGLGDNPNGQLTNYTFTGNPYTNTGWTEAGVGNPPNDRRMMSSFGPNTLIGGQEICFDFAFVVNNDSANHLANVQNLYNTSDVVQDFYDNNLHGCGQIFLSTQELSNDLEISIYPNPSTGLFTVQSDADFDYQVYDLNGKLMQSNKGFEGANQIEVDAENGIYILTIESDKGIQYKKIEILK